MPEPIITYLTPIPTPISRMQQFRRFILFFPLLAALALGAGCAANDTRLIARQLDPLIGKADKEYMIEKYGEPLSRTRVDDRTDVWEFSVAENSVSNRSVGTNATVSTRLRATFKNGVLASWQAFNALR